MVNRPRGFSLTEIMVVVSVIALLAALAIPNYMRFQARSKRSEARTNLKAMFQAQGAYYAERDGYTDKLNELGFSVERGNRYAYLTTLAPTAWQERLVETVSAAAAFEGIEVDCFRYGGSCVAQPARPAGGASFTVTWPDGVTGPSDTGVTPGTGGGFIMEARGSVDMDVEADVWLVGSGTLQVAQQTCAEAMQGVAGGPVAIYDDVACP